MAKIVEFNKTGSADVLEIRDVIVPKPEKHEVQIRVKAFAINRADLMYRNGAYVIAPVFPARLGYEAAGIVEAVGEGVVDLVVGDTVSVIPSFSFHEYGMYGELVNAPRRGVVKHSDDLSFEEAAATWMMFVTAYGALIDMAGMKGGDFVLIGAAASSTGLAAIQIANYVGAIPIALARKSDRAQALLDAGAAHVIATQEEDIVAAVARITAGKGANIAFDPVGGTEAAKLFKTLASGAQYFLYGALDARNLEVPVMDLLGKHFVVRGYELFEITLNPERLTKAVEFINAGLNKGALRPVISKTFALEDIREAHRHMESNAQMGKIIVKMG